MPACATTPDATFDLDVPDAVAQEAAWYEVGVFPGLCPSAALLEGGIPPEGTVARLAFAASAETPPGLGLLPKSTYGIGAVARAADCSVIATGCAASQVSSGGTLTVSLSAVSGSPRGACASGSVCDEASCLPNAGDAATSLGASCSLQLVGAGPLADPLNVDSTLLSAPAIAATTTGFLLAYREFDPAAGTARLTTIALDPSGGAAAPVQTSLGGSCVASPETDATGLAFSGTQGTLALSQPACPGDGDAGATSAGVDLVAIDETGTVANSAFSEQDDLGITLAPAHALASTPAGLLLAFTTPSTRAAYAATVVNLGFASSPAPVAFSRFDGLSTVTSALVVGTDFGTGLLALGSATVDGGAPRLTASLATEAADAGRAFVRTGTPYPAQWVSASGVGSRILVASNGTSSAGSILWTAFDIGSTVTSSGDFAPQSMGTVSFVDVALHQDHAFFAAEVDSDIALFAFDKASTFPVQLREVDFSSLPIIPIGSLRDGLVAVAASDTRVAVVWGTGKTLGSQDDVGGYAVFACTP